MITIVSSKIGAANIGTSLGRPEYSYYFLLKAFSLALARLGPVMEASNEAEVESLYRRYKAEGEDVVFVSFSPPQQTPLDLECPTLSLFAWEFDTIPHQAWDGHENEDWRYALGRIQGAIATSEFAAQAVRRTLGEHYPIVAIPAPLWPAYSPLGEDAGALPLVESRTIACGVLALDSRWHGFSANGLVRRPEPAPPPPTPGQRLKISMRAAKALFHALRTDPAPPQPQPRVPPEVRAPWSRVADNLSFDGVVYLAVLNPRDGRKNWADLITAFCWAFQDIEDATLLLKLSYHEQAEYQVVLMTLLSRLEPFRCRVVAILDFLPDATYESLLGASTYAVNASSGEGLCLPLIESLCAGKPVIAPRHTAMADYIDETLAFVVETSAQPASWPHDPTGKLWTKSRRLNWQSLRDAFRSSYQVATSAPAQYQAMSIAGRDRMRDYCSVDAVVEPLRRHLSAIARAVTPAGGQE